MAKGFKHLTKADRIKIEALLKAGHSIKEIAELLHVHRSTIYREVKRGIFTALWCAGRYQKGKTLTARLTKRYRI